MIISCPHCQTKYQVTFEAIGSAGRKVQCAHCRRAWDQGPLPAQEPETPAEDSDRLFTAMEEDALDDILMSEAAAVEAEAKVDAAVPARAEVAPPIAARLPDAAELQKRQQAFSRRQSAITSRLPMARLRRASRAAGFIILLGMAAGAYWGRTQIVERYPDLAGLYAAVGLGVNVVGLDFSNLKTLKTLANGTDVLMVSAQIVGLTPTPRAVPPVVVSLLDESGHPVYEWSVVPQVRDLMAGERATFDTRLSQPPVEATRVRLSFAGGDAGETASGAAPTEPDAHAEAPAETHAAAAPAEAAPAHHEPAAQEHAAAPAHH